MEWISYLKQKLLRILHIRKQHEMNAQVFCNLFTTKNNFRISHVSPDQPQSISDNYYNLNYWKKIHSMNMSPAMVVEEGIEAEHSF